MAVLVALKFFVSYFYGIGRFGDGTGTWLFVALCETVYPVINIRS